MICFVDFKSFNGRILNFLTNRLKSAIKTFLRLKMEMEIQ